MSKLSDVLGLPRNPKEHALKVAILSTSSIINSQLAKVTYSKSLIPCNYVILQDDSETECIYQTIADLAADGVDAIISIGICYGYTTSIGDIIIPNAFYNTTAEYCIDPFRLNADSVLQSDHITSSDCNIRSKYNINNMVRGHYDGETYKIEHACRHLNLIHKSVQIVSNCFDDSITQEIFHNKLNDILDMINTCYESINTQFTASIEE